ncbi:MAG: hypothetical protein R2695_12760 [Acidimicrobiales bacterium]
MTDQLGEAFDALLDTLRDRAGWIRAHPFYEDEENRAAGYMFLLHMLVLHLEEDLFHDAEFPTFHVIDPRTRSGGDNPDQRYLMSRINGGETYRIWGRRGSERRVEAQIYAGDPYIKGSSGRSAGFLAHEDLEIDADGRFEIIASPERQPGNWIENPPDGTRLLVRQTYGEWGDHDMGEIHIDRVGHEERSSRSSEPTSSPVGSVGPQPPSTPTWGSGRRWSASSTWRAFPPTRSRRRSTLARSAACRAGSWRSARGTWRTTRRSWSPPGRPTATTKASPSPTSGGRRSSTPTGRRA